jgi:hypothetical protein
MDLPQLTTAQFAMGVLAGVLVLVAIGFGIVAWAGWCSMPSRVKRGGRPR